MNIEELNVGDNLVYIPGGLPCTVVEVESWGEVGSGIVTIQDDETGQIGQWNADELDQFQTRGAVLTEDDLLSGETI